MQRAAPKSWADQVVDDAKTLGWSSVVAERMLHTRVTRVTGRCWLCGAERSAEYAELEAESVGDVFIASVKTTMRHANCARRP
jgi:hypothetical protein